MSVDPAEPLPRHHEHLIYQVIEDAAGTRLEPGRQPRFGCGLVSLAVISGLIWWFESTWCAGLSASTRVVIAAGVALLVTVLAVIGMATADRQQAALGPYLITDLPQGCWNLPRRGVSIPFAHLVGVEWLVVRQPPSSRERIISTHVQVNLRHRTANGVVRTNLITVEGHEQHAVLRELAQRMAARAQLTVDENDMTFSDEAAYQLWNRGRWPQRQSGDHA